MVIASDYAGVGTTFRVVKRGPERAGATGLRGSLVDCSSPVTGHLLHGPALTLQCWAALVSTVQPSFPLSHRVTFRWTPTLVFPPIQRNHATRETIYHPQRVIRSPRQQLPSSQAQQRSSASWPELLC